LLKWGKRYAKLCAWVEENIEETLSFDRLPRQHHKNLKSTNMRERLMEEIKRRTLVVRIFPNAAACLRLVRALAVETHENWIEAMQYLNMDPLREQKKEALQSWETRHEGFYSAGQGEALIAALALDPLPAQRSSLTHYQFAEFDKHNSPMFSVKPIALRGLDKCAPFSTRRVGGLPCAR
jgi:hypothetical protein